MKCTKSSSALQAVQSLQSMSRCRSWRSVTCLVALALVSCGEREDATAAPGGAPSAPAASPSPVTKMQLPQDPGQAQDVRDAKAGGAKESAVVVGRVASIVPGHAVLTLMDASLPYCGQKNAEDGCETPWDYCCESTDTRTANALVVEMRDAAGQPLRSGVAPDLRLLDLVAATGKLEKDQHGNFVLVADGWFRRDRPQLPAHVRWPK